MDHPNTRRHARVYCGARGKIEGPRGPIRGIVRNISQGGAFFLSPTLLPVGEAVEMTLELPGGQPIRAMGEIRYHYRYLEGEGMGIRFLRLTGEDLAALARFIDARHST